MKKSTVTKYQVITRDFKKIIKKGFTNWDDAYMYALFHDYGQYQNHGGLCAVAYTA